MHCLLSLIIFATALADDGNAVPNTLSPKEAADGWLLLFDGDTEFGWRGNAKADKGVLKVDGDEGKPALARSAGPFREWELQFEYAQTGLPATLTLVGQGTKATEIKLPAPTGTGKRWSSFKQRSAPGAGSVSLEWTVPSGAVLQLKNVKLRPLNLQSLFNGKDLTGWKEFPGKKSKFTITPEGAINIKNGPGDLQTEGQYDNFVLQLDCISNGAHLNSGVFFRCRPNEYQNGYEAQIRNQFTADATQEYTLEDYDPQTNKLRAKKKVKFTAVDYGTGAIYRRQPARKEVAKDGAWFTFTILAHKNHLMTWVNGIQVADWTDNRPKSDNARTGCRLEAGHISLQGHDPTTDLSFRKFRIGVLD